MIINTMISEILGIVLSLLSSAYFYLTELLLILIISPIILLIVTFSPSLPNKTKKFILYFNMFYSLSLLFIPELLLIILKYEMILNNIFLNNIYMTSYFSIFGSILVEIYRNIILFIKIYIIFINIYVIIIIISLLMIIYYVFREITHYEFKKTLNFIEYKKYINNNYIINNNKKFFITTVSISLISGFVLFFFILPTYSGYYIRVLFLIILLIAAILSYWLLFNQKNIIKILSKLSEDAIDMIILWSSILLLNFSGVSRSITNISSFYPPLSIPFAYIIIVLTIFFLMYIMSRYVYIVNINKSVENNTDKNTEKLAKWTVVTGFSISLLIVYLLGNSLIWYKILGISSFFILIYVYPYVHSCIKNNINKKNLNDILGIILSAYIISSTILYPVIEVLYLAIIYVFLTVIPLFFYCILKINKEKDYNKQ